MKIVFLGSAHFAEPSLRALIENNHQVACVVTQPDRLKGRGMHLGETPVKALARKTGLNIYQPEDVNGRESSAFLKDQKADMFILIAYGQILSQEVLDIPKDYCLNLHASLLPKYRGAAPINWALINGDKTSGITVIKVARKMDAGPILAQKEISIDAADTFVTLENKLSLQGAQLLLASIKELNAGNNKFIPQDESKVSFAPKLKKEDGLIDWEKSARETYNLIRGCLPWPGAFTYYRGKLLKIDKAEVVVSSEDDSNYKPGELVEASREGIVVACKKGLLKILELQLEGKKMMKAKDFILGHKILSGTILGK